MKTDLLNRKLSIALGTFGLLIGSMNGAHAQVYTPTQAPGFGSATSSPNTTVGNDGSWSSSVFETLQNDRREAIVVGFAGNIQDSLAAWEYTFRNLLQSQGTPGNQFRLMYKIAERTIQIASSLEISAAEEAKKCPAVNGDDCIRSKYVPIFMIYEHGFSLIKDFQKFDEPYYASHRALREASYAAPIAIDQKEFSLGLRDFALQQLKWFREKFSTQSVDEVGSKFSSKTYYVVLNEILKGLIFDFGGDNANPNPNLPLFVTAYSKPSKLMGDLSKKLTQQIAGNQTVGNGSVAFWSVNKELEIIVEGLNGLEGRPQN